jgi:hypothetical protein
MRSRGWRSRADGSLVVGAALRWADLLRRPIAALGVDFPRFRTLLELRLLIDVARPIGVGGSTGGVSIGVVLTALLFFGIGIVAGILALVIPDAFVWVALSQSMLMAMLAMVMLLQYGEILVDPTDIHVVGPLPVDDRTLFAARLAHLACYVGLLTLAFLVLPVFLASFAYPPWVVLPLYPLLTAIAALVTVSLVALLHAACLRVFGPALFQRATVWMHVALAASWFGGIYVLPKLVPWRHVIPVLEAHPELLGALPPFHLAGLFELALGEVNARNVLFAAAALALGPLALWATLRLASRQFAAGLASGLGGAAPRRGGWKHPLASRLGARCVRSRAERAGLDWAIAQSRREPTFLRAGLAQLVGFCLMGLGMVMPLREVDALRGAEPFALYVLLLLLPGLLETARFTSHPEAGWILRALPIADAGALLSGAIKGVFFGVALPVVLVFALVLVLLAGPRSLPDLLLALELAAIVGFRALHSMDLEIPFTRSARTGGDISLKNLGTAMAMLAVGALAAGLHLVVRLSPWSLWAAVVCLAPLAWREFRGLERLRPATSWLWIEDAGGAAPGRSASRRTGPERVPRRG